MCYFERKQNVTQLFLLFGEVCNKFLTLLSLAQVSLKGLKVRLEFQNALFCFNDV